MIKRTLYFGNPAYLKMRNAQLVVHLPEVVKNNDLPESFKKEAQATIAIEDIGVVLLDHKQITITHGLLEALLANNVAVITCDSSRMPGGFFCLLVAILFRAKGFRHRLMQQCHCVNNFGSKLYRPKSAIRLMCSTIAVALW
jgi:CRISPR-associated protein Cas1